MSKAESKLVVFAKAPAPGKVKTRLQPALSIHDAAKLQAFFIQKTLAMLANLDEIDVELHCFPDDAHPVFHQCAQEYGITLKPQQGRNLGERMANAFQEALVAYEQAVVIGTDCPEITPNYVHEAFLRLSQVDAVIGPAHDGGYVLLGLQRFSPELFVNINWSTDQVLSKTREKLHALGWKWDELQTLRDIDTADDLSHFPNVIRDASLSYKL